MAETVQGLTIEVRIYGTVSGDDGAKLVVDETYKKTFSDGTGTDQVGTIWQDQSRNLNATSEDLNLDALTDFQGAATGATNVAFMYLRNLDTDTGDKFLLGGASGNQFINWVGDATDTVDIGPDGIFLLVSPVDKYAITASTGDLLKVQSADNSNYRFIFGGDNS